MWIEPKVVDARDLVPLTYLVSPGKPPAYAGTDFMVVRDGKIAAVYLFFDELP